MFMFFECFLWMVLFGVVGVIWCCFVFLGMLMMSFFGLVGLSACIVGAVCVAGSCWLLLVFLFLCCLCAC